MMPQYAVIVLVWVAAAANIASLVASFKKRVTMEYKCLVWTLGLSIVIAGDQLLAGDLVMVAIYVGISAVTVFTLSMVRRRLPVRNS